jgi:hypothetical protein
MAATSTVVDKLTLTMVFAPVKSRFIGAIATIRKRISFWWRGGRKGGTLVTRV